jgi:hypothetical protein
MNPITVITDSYERKARLYPALLLVAPVVIAIVGAGSTKLSALESIGAVVAGCGGAFLLTQLGRDAGKKCEKPLFESWGGLPSVAVFRHRDARIDAITKARYHKQMAALVKNAKAPSPEEEAADWEKADQIYTAWSSYLRVHTRDMKRYPLVFQENISYGYRRNVCGLRPLGVTVSTLSLGCGAIWFYHLHLTTGTVSKESVGALICVALILLLWIFQFTPKWVRIAADAYAERLTETVESMKSSSPSSIRQTKEKTA